MKDKRFELRMSAKELKALDRLVKKDGYPSRAAWVIAQIRIGETLHKVAGKLKGVPQSVEYGYML